MDSEIEHYLNELFKTFLDFLKSLLRLCFISLLLLRCIILYRLYPFLKDCATCITYGFTESLQRLLNWYLGLPLRQRSFLHYVMAFLLLGYIVCRYNFIRRITRKYGKLKQRIYKQSAQIRQSISVYSKWIRTIFRHILLLVVPLVLIHGFLPQFLNPRLFRYLLNAIRSVTPVLYSTGVITQIKLKAHHSLKNDETAERNSNDIRHLTTKPTMSINSFFTSHLRSASDKPEAILSEQHSDSSNSVQSGSDDAYSKIGSGIRQTHLSMKKNPQPVRCKDRRSVTQRHSQNLSMDSEESYDNGTRQKNRHSNAMKFHVYKTMSDASINYYLLIWLDYWILAITFDTLFWVVSGILSVLGIPVVSLDFYHAGLIEDSFFVSKSAPVSSRFINVISPKVLKWYWRSLFYLIYDFYFTVLLSCSVCSNFKLLSVVRQLLYSLVNSMIFVVFGVTPFPATTNYSAYLFRLPEKNLATMQTPTQSASESSHHLMLTLWQALKGYFPHQLHILLDILNHVPQLFLLLVPSFFMPGVIVCMKTLYPLYHSFCALATTRQSKKLYWLTYFVLQMLYEAIAVMWLRHTFIWKYIPLRHHRELLCLILIQIISSNPEYYFTYLFYELFHHSPNFTCDTPASTVHHGMDNPKSVRQSEYTNSADITSPRYALRPESQKNSTVLGKKFIPAAATIPSPVDYSDAD